MRLLYVYIVIWLEHHWNKLYGFMGLRSKMLGEWTGMEWINTPQTVMTSTSPAVLKIEGNFTKKYKYFTQLPLVPL